MDEREVHKAIMNTNKEIQKQDRREVIFKRQKIAEAHREEIQREKDAK